MKNQLTQLQLRHAILLNEMQLHSRLSKTLEDLLRQELSSVEQSIDKKDNINELHIHSRLAKRLEDLLRQELSRVEECFHEMECLSLELLVLQEEVQEHELENA